MYGEAEASLAARSTAARRGDRRDEDLGRRRSRRAASSTRASSSWFGRVDVEQIHNLVNWREHLRGSRRSATPARIGRLGVTHWQASAFRDLAGRCARPLRAGAAAVQPARARMRGEAPAARGGARARGDRRCGRSATARLADALAGRGARAAARVRRRDVAAGAAQVGALRRADRRRDPATRPEQRARTPPPAAALVRRATSSSTLAGLTRQHAPGDSAARPRFEPRGSARVRATCAGVLSVSLRPPCGSASPRRSRPTSTASR